MAAVPYHFTTAASTNLQPVRAGSTANLKGFAMANVATAMFLKFYWFTPTGSAVSPTVGTTVPNLTLGFAASVNTNQSWPDGITANGQLWIAVTAAAADSDVAVAA